MKRGVVAAVRRHPEDVATMAAGAIDVGVASGGADGGVERERSKLDGREGCM